tara:strand:+ start:457 stop:720 length:264 start_codon:yes stop_codon:yes gene_type:complete
VNAKFGVQAVGLRIFVEFGFRKLLNKTVGIRNTIVGLHPIVAVLAEELLLSIDMTQYAFLADTLSALLAYWALGGFDHQQSCNDDNK